MRLYDVTVTLRPGMPTYASEPGPELIPLARIAAGDPADVSLLRVGTHAGTHVDAPAHFLPGGAGVDRLPLEVLVGPARVVEVGPARVISPALLAAAGLAERVERVLLKTTSSRLWADGGPRLESAYLDVDAARWLVERGARLVGIDEFSIERDDRPDYPVHHLLLAAGVVVLEGLDLRQVPAGEYTLACLPLKLADADGAPARVVLWREDDG